jgi:glycosyltransferase involved in cell wall biosynthesis
MTQKKRRLYIIMASAGELSEKERFGFLGRFRKQVDFYSKSFDVVVYSSDSKNYSRELGAKHVTLSWLPRTPVIKHLLYYLFLIVSSPLFRRGVIRIFGVSNPSLPLIRLFSGNKIAASYHYDWVEQERLHHNRLKWLFAAITERLAFLGVDHVLATTERLSRKISRKYRKETSLLPNFVDDSLFKPSRTKKRQIIFTGRIQWLKGINHLLEAIALYDKSLRLIVAGEGPEKTKLIRLSRSLGLKNVEFTGAIPQERLSRMVAESYALVLPTITMEGHPKVIIEAFACGTPCIVTDILGSREIVKHKKTGIIVKPGDPEELSSAIREIVSNDRLRKSLSVNALEEGKAYSFRKIMNQENRILEKLSR